MERTLRSPRILSFVGSMKNLICSGMSSEESDGPSSEKTDKELALTKAVDVMVLSMECLPLFSEDNNSSHECEIKCHEKYSKFETESISDMAAELYESTQKTNSKMSSEEKASNGSRGKTFEKHVEEGAMLSYQRNVTVLCVLLYSAFVERILTMTRDVLN